jgi:hypothetical protein
LLPDGVRVAAVGEHIHHEIGAPSGEDALSRRKQGASALCARPRPPSRVVQVSSSDRPLANCFRGGTGVGRGLMRFTSMRCAGVIGAAPLRQCRGDSFVSSEGSGGTRPKRLAQQIRARILTIALFFEPGRKANENRVILPGCRVHGTGSLRRRVRMPDPRGLPPSVARTTNCPPGDPAPSATGS